MRQADALQTYQQFLQQEGWDPSAIYFKKQLEIQSDPHEAPLVARLASLVHQDDPLATLAVIDGLRLPSGITLYQRFVDMTIEARLALDAAAALAPAPRICVASPYECYLYDAQAEELLVAATSPEETASRIFSLIRPEEGAAAGMDRLPRRNAQQWGKELADWLRVWSAKLGRAARISPETTHALLSIWTIAWKDMLAESPPGQFPLPGMRIHSVGEACAASALPPSPVQFYQSHIRRVLRRMPFGILLARTEALERFWTNESIAPLLTSFLAEARLLSRSKFLAHNAIYAFSCEEIEKRSWRKALTQTVRIGQWLNRSDLTIYDPITVSIGGDGYGWSLSILEDLLRFWIEENLKRKHESEQHGRLGTQMDFFAPAPEGLNAAGVLDDILSFIIAHCYRIQTASADERFSAAILLALKIYELAAAYDLPLNDLNAIDLVFA